MQATLERLLAELVLGSAPARDPAAFRAYLAGLPLPDADRAALVTNFAGLLVYRRLVRSRLHEAIELAIPRALARLGPLFDGYFEQFLAERGPRTHYLRDVTSEFLDFCAPLFAADPRVPPYLMELARHEALEIEIASGADPEARALDAELHLDSSLRFIEAARVVRYAFAVHRLPDDRNDRGEPEHVPTALFVYRSPEHDVRYLELTPLAAAILERLLLGATLRGALTSATAVASHPLDESVLTGTARILSSLAERGALIGPSAPNPAQAAP